MRWRVKQRVKFSYIHAHDIIIDAVEKFPGVKEVIDGADLRDNKRAEKLQ